MPSLRCMGAQPALRFRHSGQAARGLWSACLIVVLLASCAAPLPVATTPASAAPVWAPAASTAPAWSSINWTADDEALFGGPGNQYIFGGTSWAGGTVLVGEDDGLDPGMGDAVVWVSADNAHWRRIPNSGGTFSDASMRAVASSGSNSF